MDRVLALLLVGATQALVWADGGSWPGRLASAVAALSVAAVAWRRAYPVVGLAVLFGALVLDSAAAGHFANAFVPAFAAMLLLVFTVGERPGWVRPAAAALVVAAGLTAAQLLRPDPAHTLLSQIGFFGVVGVLLPLAAGRARGTHRRRTAALHEVRAATVATRGARLARATEDERTRLAEALDALTTDSLQELELAVAEIRDREDATRVAASARALLTRLRATIGQLHAVDDLAAPAGLGQLAGRVDALADGPGEPWLATAPPERPVATRSRVRRAAALALVGAAAWVDVVVEADWPRPAVLLPVALLLVIAPLIWLPRAPRAVTVAVCFLLVGFSAVVSPVAPLLAGNLLLLLPYGCARYGGVRAAVTGAVVCAATAVAVVVVAREDLSADDWPTTALLVLAAAGTGLLVHRESLLASQLRSATRELESEQAQAEQLVRRRRREDVARDLHDAVAHSLTVVALQAAAAARVWDQDQARRAEHLGALQATTAETLAELARLVRALPTAENDHPDLAQLDGLVARARAAGIDIELTLAGDPAALPARDQATAYRIVQECLTNAADHGHGMLVSVRLAVEGGRIAIAVTNPVPATGVRRRQAGRGRGLANLAERVRSAGGELSAGPDPDGFFVVSATVGRPA